MFPILAVGVGGRNSHCCMVLWLTAVATVIFHNYTYFHILTSPSTKLNASGTGIFLLGAGLAGRPTLQKAMVNMCKRGICDSFKHVFSLSLIGTPPPLDLTSPLRLPSSVVLNLGKNRSWDDSFSFSDDFAGRLCIKKSNTSKWLSFAILPPALAPKREMIAPSSTYANTNHEKTSKHGVALVFDCFE